MTEEQKKQAARARVDARIASETALSGGIESISRGVRTSVPAKYAFWCQV